MKVLLNKVGEKIEKLIDSHSLLTQENKILLEQKENLLQEISLLKSNIKNLNHRLNEVVISNSFQNNQNDNVLAKKKINMFLREIDKCIALLNN